MEGEELTSLAAASINFGACLALPILLITSALGANVGGGGWGKFIFLFGSDSPYILRSLASLSSCSFFSSVRFLYSSSAILTIISSSSGLACAAGDGAVDFVADDDDDIAKVDR